MQLLHDSRLIFPLLFTHGCPAVLFTGSFGKASFERRIWKWSQGGWIFFVKKMLGTPAGMGVEQCILLIFKYLHQKHCASIFFNDYPKIALRYSIRSVYFFCVLYALCSCSSCFCVFVFWRCFAQTLINDLGEVPQKHKNTKTQKHEEHQEHNA